MHFVLLEIEYLFQLTSNCNELFLSICYFFPPPTRLKSSPAHCLAVLTALSSIAAHNDFECLTECINEELSRVSTWFWFNKLTLVVKKRLFTVFCNEIVSGAIKDEGLN